MNWAFVDYENVGSMEGLKLDGYERVFVLCGPRNTRVKLAPPPGDGFCKLELIGVSTIGPNNLDFHLAFHLGRYHETTDKEVAFHIISSDNDYDGLVLHLKKLGRSCKRVSPKAEARQSHKTESTQPPKAEVRHSPKAEGRQSPKTEARHSPKAEVSHAAGNKIPALSEGAKQVIDKLKGAGRSRPRKKDALINWIKNRSQGLVDIDPAAIYEELVQAERIIESGKDVSYDLGRGGI